MKSDIKIWVLTTYKNIITSKLLKASNLTKMKCQQQVEAAIIKTYNNIKPNYENIPLPYININIITT